MFWGVTLNSGKRYAQTVEASYHLTMAALLPAKDGKKGNVTVYVEADDKQEHLLGTLNSENTLQLPLNLIFVEGQEIAFFINGPGTVHLTGYILPEDDSYDDGFGNFDEEGSDEEVSELSEEEPSNAGSAGKRKNEAPVAAVNKKKAKVDASAAKKAQPTNKQVNGKAKAPKAEEDSGDDDESDDSNAEDFSALMEQIKAARGDAGGDSDDSDDDDDSDVDEDDVKAAIAKAQQSKLKANIGKGTPQQGQKQAPAKQTIGQQKQTPGKPQQNQKSAQKNKNKQGGQGDQKKDSPPKGQQQKGGPPAVKGIIKTPNPQAGTPGNKQQQNSGNKGQNSFGKNKGGVQTPGAGGGQNKDTPAKAKKLAGGLIIEDVREGNGPEVRSGKLAHVMYVGRLANNKEFDRSVKPFSFHLGRGEVIKGWDQGVAGMKVGGKRKIIVPSTLGYGKRATGPIPANSELHFEVELKSVT